VGSFPASLTLTPQVLKLSTKNEKHFRNIEALEIEPPRY
jgi:hypothetical protein